MSRSETQRPRVRDPSTIAARWRRRRGGIFVSDPTTEPISLRIRSEHETGISEVDISQAAGGVHDVGEHRFRQNWYLHESTGPYTDLAEEVGGIIHIACFPAPGSHNNGKEMRSYNDMLFSGGRFEIALPTYLNPEAPKQTFDMGQVIGLEIVTAKEHYNIW